MSFKSIKYQAKSKKNDSFCDFLQNFPSFFLHSDILSVTLQP